jgi:hypothetical protein
MPEICPTCHQPIGVSTASRAVREDCRCPICGNEQVCNPGKLCNAALKFDEEGKPIDIRKSGNCRGVMTPIAEFAKIEAAKSIKVPDKVPAAVK